MDERHPLVSELRSLKAFGLHRGGARLERLRAPGPRRPGAEAFGVVAMVCSQLSKLDLAKVNVLLTRASDVATMNIIPEVIIPLLGDVVPRIAHDGRLRIGALSDAGSVNDAMAEALSETVRLIDKYTWLAHVVSMPMLQSPRGAQHLAMLMERMRSPSIYLEEPLRELVNSVIPDTTFTKLDKPLLVIGVPTGLAFPYMASASAGYVTRISPHVICDGPNAAIAPSAAPTSRTATASTFRRTGCIRTMRGLRRCWSALSTARPTRNAQAR